MTAPPDAWSAAFFRLANVQPNQRARRQPFNPHPPGEIRPWSMTARVLELLRANPNRRWREHEIRWTLNASRPSVSWALICLRSQGLIESISNAAPSTPARYLLYCHAPATEDADAPTSPAPVVTQQEPEADPQPTTDEGAST